MRRSRFDSLPSLLRRASLLRALSGAVALSAVTATMVKAEDFRNLRDPTTPLDEVVDTAPSLPEFKLQAIFTHKGVGSAVINKERRQVGQSIDGFIVTKIGERQVQLRRGERSITLILSRRSRGR